MLFCTHLLTSLLRCGQLNALLLCCSLHRRDAERGDTAPGEARLAARGAALETSSNWAIAKVYPKKSLGLSVLYILWKKAAKRVWKFQNIELRCARVCETWELMQRAVDIVDKFFCVITFYSFSFGTFMHSNTIQLCPRHNALVKRDPPQTVLCSERYLNDTGIAVF